MAKTPRYLTPDTNAGTRRPKPELQPIITSGPTIDNGGSRFAGDADQAAAQQREGVSPSGTGAPIAAPVFRGPVVSNPANIASPDNSRSTI